MISARRAIFVGAIALTVGALTAFAVASSAERDDSFEAIATIGIGPELPTEELDGARETMLALLPPERIESILDDAGATEVDFITPDDRSNIVIVTRAASGPPALAAANALLDELSAREAEPVTTAADEARAALEAEEGPLQAEQERIQAQIDASPAEEARLTVPLAGFLEDEERAAIEAELGAVQEQWQALRTERDMVVDELSSLQNDIRRAEVRQATAVTPPILVVPTVRDTADDLVRSAFVTFLLAGAAAMAAGLTLTSPRRVP